MVPLLAEGLWLPEFTSWLSQLNSMVAWSRFPVPWTWFHDCLKAPDSLNSLSGSLYLVPWFPGEGFCLSGFGSWLPGLGTMVA